MHVLSSQPPRPKLLPGKTRRTAIVIVLGLMVLGGTLTPLLFSQTPSHPAEGAAAPEGQADLAAPLRRLALGTAAVLALAVLTLWGCGRWLKRDAPPQTGQMVVLGRLAVDRRSHVFLVRAAGHRLLAAVDINGLKALVPVAAPAEEEEAEGGEAGQ